MTRCDVRLVDEVKSFVMGATALSSLENSAVLRELFANGTYHAYGSQVALRGDAGVRNLTEAEVSKCGTREQCIRFRSLPFFFRCTYKRVIMIKQEYNFCKM